MSFFNHWKSDFRASLVVFLIALPLCLGVALGSGAPLAAGLFGGIIGGIVVGSISGSPVSVSSPAAGLTVIVVTSIQTLGSFEALALAVFLSGLIQIVLGLARAGTIGDYFPSSVVKGMLTAIGLILVLKQLPHALGFDVDYMGDESFEESQGRNTFSTILAAFQYFHVGAVLISLSAMGIMLVWDKADVKKIKFFQTIPGPLVGVLIGIFLNYVFSLSSPELALGKGQLVTLPFEGGFRAFIAGFNFPNWIHLGNPDIYKIALTIAIVGSLESLLSIDAADKLVEDARTTDKNRELFAQGLGNSLSGFIGGLPITAVIVRTSANINSGAKTKFSAILHGFWLLLFVIFIPEWLNLIPLSALAAILILIGYKLAKPELIRSMYTKGMDQFIPFAVTIIAILLTDLLMGIMIGIVVGFVFVFKSNIHNSIVMVQEKDLYLIRFYKDVSFLQKAKLQKLLNEIPENSTLILDGSNTVYVDNDIVDLIEEFSRRSQNLNIRVDLKKSALALCPIFREENNGKN
jgi:MFS superfamily sulfate permease-like transporter